VRDHLVFGEVGGVDALEEVVECYLAPAHVRQLRGAGARARSRRPGDVVQPVDGLLVPALARGDDDRGVECEQYGGQVGRWVAVRHRAADRAPGADLRVGEDREGVGHGRDDAGAAPLPAPVDRVTIGVEAVAAELAVGGERAEHHAEAAAEPRHPAPGAQFLQARDVNEDLRRGEAELHHGQQRLTAGDELGLLAGLRGLVEQVKGLVK
jgi:hypothetical protein